MCVYENHWSFLEVDNPIGPECHVCEEVCMHNPQFNPETDTLNAAFPEFDPEENGIDESFIDEEFSDN